jgi:hypothetical protein
VAKYLKRERLDFREERGPGDRIPKSAREDMRGEVEKMFE